MTGTFPGGTSVSLLDVYDSAAPDGLRGGSPHMHLVSTEAYLVFAGSGALQTIDNDGFRETPLAPGVVVWFTPGTIHRAVNHGGLRAFVVMSNAGLPEAGDAVMAFPPDLVADAGAYAAAADLGSGDERAGRAADRRDLAVEGFLRLRASVEAGDPAPLAEFRATAGALVRGRAAGWERIVRIGPLAQAEQSIGLAQAVAAGVAAHLGGAAARSAGAPDERGYGMCGRLTPYAVGDPA